MQGWSAGSVSKISNSRRFWFYFCFVPHFRVIKSASAVENLFNLRTRTCTLHVRMMNFRTANKNDKHSSFELNVFLEVTSLNLSN